MTRPPIPGRRAALSWVPLLMLAGSPGACAWAATIDPPLLPPPGTWIPTAGGTVRVLDKQKASTALLTLAVGQTVRFETLSITMGACDAHAPDVPADAAGRLVVTDSRSGEPGFQGWMLANEPWVAMLQSPVYGVRVVGCDKPSAEAVAAVMPKPPAQNAGPAPSAGSGSAGSGSAGALPAGALPAGAAPPPPSDLDAPPGQDFGQDPDAAPTPVPAPSGDAGGRP